MEVKETERTIIAKPVASRPKTSNFRSFSELLAGAINDSPSSEPTITAIRPKTVRFKPAMSSPPIETVSSQAELADTVLKSNHEPPLLYKPLAKTVSRTTISLLANMGNFNTSHEQPLAHNLVTNPQKSAPIKPANDKRSQSHTNNTDWPSYDGYNWRKYGQKQVKGSEYPRSYYKCTHPNCLVKKKVERSINGKINEIVYKGEHNHSKPRIPRRCSSDGTIKDSIRKLPNNQFDDDNEGGKGIKINEVLGSSSRLTNLVKVRESGEEFDASMQRMMETEDHQPTSKKRKTLTQLNETNGDSLQEPRIVVQNCTDSEVLLDGFRWRKYGQKVVKGNPYPRSYYRCTGLECNVRKHVERASDDPSVFITTYEGKHNHEMPIKKTNLTVEPELTQSAFLMN